MPTRVTAEPTKITVVCAGRWADVGVPPDLPLADLIPALVVHLGNDDLEGHRVVLQRLGADPLNEDHSLAVLGVRDGETLYLRPAPDRLPAIWFDDLVDGVATGVRRQPHWTNERVRSLWLGCAALVCWAGLGTLWLAGPADLVWLRALALVPPLVAALIGAALLSRRSWGPPFATFLVAAVVMPASAVAGGLLAPGAPAPLWAVGAWAGGALAVSSALSSLVVRGCGPLNAAAGLLCLAGAVAGLLVTTLPVRTSQVCLLTLVLGSLAGQLLPANAYRLAGIRVPTLSARRRDLSDDVDPIPGTPLLERTRMAHRYFTATTLALAVVMLAAGVVAMQDHGAWATAVIAVTGLLQLVRARSFIGIGQRLGPVAVGLGLLVGLVATRLAGDSAISVAAAGTLLFGFAALLVAAARLLPGRPLIPHLGRAAELFEGVAALSLVPMALAAADVYALVKGIPG